MPSFIAKSSCSQFDQGNVILLVVKSIAYQQPGGGGVAKESLGGVGLGLGLGLGPV